MLHSIFVLIEMFKTLHLSACVSSHIPGESVSTYFPVALKAVILNA